MADMVSRLPGVKASVVGWRSVRLSPPQRNFSCLESGRHLDLQWLGECSCRRMREVDPCEGA